MKKILLCLILALCLVSTLGSPSVSALDKSIVYPRTKLKDVAVSGYSYTYSPKSNLAVGKNNEFFTDKDGNLALFSYNGGNKPTVYVFDKNYKVTSSTVLKLPSHDLYGSFTIASDGNYYVVLGHKNKKEEAKKTVISLLKVSQKTGEVIKKGELKGNQFGTQLSTIKDPISAGSADLVERNGKLYMHMSYTMFKSKDGKNHQAASLFVFDASSLKPKEVKQDFYVSHSMNQMIKLDGSTIVTLTHGDAHPRAIRLATLDSKGNFKKVDIFSIKGATGKNETGTTISGLESGPNSYLVTGNSVTHNTPVNGKYSPSGEWYNGRNVYLSIINKKNLGVKNIWLTNFDPNNKDITITDPRVFRIGNSFVVVYSVSQYDKSYTEFVTVSETGDMLARYKKENTAFYSNSYPIVYKNNIIWIAPYASDMEYSYVGGANTKIYKYKFDDTKNIYLFEIDLSNPKSPKWVEGVRPQSVVIEQKNVALDWGDATKLTAKVLPENSPFDDFTWSSSGSLRFKISSDGYVTAINQLGDTGEVYAFSTIDRSIYTKLTVKSNAKEKSPIAKSTVSTPKNKQVGSYSTYECYLLEKGKKTKNVKLKDSSGTVPEYYLTSSDESIVKIVDSNIPAGINYGTATIYFHTKDKKNVASCEIVVVPKKADGTYILQKPKTNFTRNEPFETSGFLAVEISNKGKKITYYNDKQVAFCVSDLTGITVQEIWGRGRPLTKTGNMKIRVIVRGKEVSYTIKVGTSNLSSVNNNETKVLKDGRYSLRVMYNYLNIASDGGAELRNVTPNPVFEIEKQTDGTYTMKTESNRYLGTSGTIVDGIQLKEVDALYYWKLYSENNNDIFSIRPTSDLAMVVNASGEKNTDGTLIILWTHENTNAPNHAEFRFIPVD